MSMSEQEFLTPKQIQAEYEFAAVYGLDVMAGRLLEVHDGHVGAAIRSLVRSMQMQQDGDFLDDDDMAGWCHLATLAERTRRSGAFNVDD